MNLNGWNLNCSMQLEEEGQLWNLSPGRQERSELLQKKKRVRKRDLISSALPILKMPNSVVEQHLCAIASPASWQARNRPKRTTQPQRNENLVLPRAILPEIRHGSGLQHSILHSRSRSPSRIILLAKNKKQKKKTKVFYGQTIQAYVVGAPAIGAVVRHAGSQIGFGD